MLLKHTLFPYPVKFHESFKSVLIDDVFRLPFGVLGAFLKRGVLLKAHNATVPKDNSGNADYIINFIVGDPGNSIYMAMDGSGVAVTLPCADPGAIEEFNSLGTMNYLRTSDDILIGAYNDDLAVLTFSRLDAEEYYGQRRVSNDIALCQILMDIVVTIVHKMASGRAAVAVNARDADLERISNLMKSSNRSDRVAYRIVSDVGRCMSQISQYYQALDSLQLYYKSYAVKRGGFVDDVRNRLFNFKDEIVDMDDLHVRLGRLVDFGMYEKVAFDDSVVRAVTPPILVNYDQHVFNMGRYSLCINPRHDFNVAVTRPEEEQSFPLTQYVHPHVSRDNRLCFGDENQRAAELYYAGDLPGLLELAWVALNNFTPGDAYVRSMHYFDIEGDYLLSKDGYICTACDVRKTSACITACPRQVYGCNDCVDRGNDACFTRCPKNENFESVRPCTTCSYNQYALDYEKKCITGCSYNSQWRLRNVCYELCFSKLGPYANIYPCETCEYSSIRNRLERRGRINSLDELVQEWMKIGKMKICDRCSNYEGGSYEDIMECIVCPDNARWDLVHPCKAKCFNRYGVTMMSYADCVRCPYYPIRERKEISGAVALLQDLIEKWAREAVVEDPNQLVFA